MADTIISNTPSSRSDSGMAGGVIALLIIIAMVVAGVVLYQNNFFRSATDTNDTTNINVTTPDLVPKPITPVPPVPAE